MTMLSFILAAVVIWRGVVPLKLHYGWRIAIGVVTALIAFKFKLAHWLGGPNYFAPELHPGFLLAGSALFSILLLFFTLLTCFEIGYAFVFLYLKIRKIQYNKAKMRLWCNRIHGGLLALAVVLAAIGSYCAMKMPTIKQHDVTIANLPEKAENLRIVFLTDIHADNITRANKIRKLVNAVNDLKPDLILLGGDYVDGRRSNIGKELLPIKDLHAKYGVYGVVGNHEYYSGFEQWVPYLKELNINLLLNENKIIEPGICIAGLTDHAAKRFPDLEMPSLEKALKNVPENIPVILINHRPSAAAYKAAEKGVALQLSGHTHGGMLWGLNLLVKMFNSGFVSGWYNVEKMQLYVSNGTGIWNGFPVRIGCPAEITVLTLKNSRGNFKRPAKFD